MRNIIKLLLVFVALGFVACRKDGTQPSLLYGTFYSAASNGLASAKTTLVLDSTKASSTTATTFSWPAVNFGDGVLATYTLQFDVPTDSFKNPISVAAGTSVLSKTYTVADLNKLVYQSLGLPAGSAGTVLVRAKADANQYNGSASTVPSAISNTVTMTVTPYQIILIFPNLWVPGDYQGWDPASAPTLASVKSNDIYEGYLNVPSGGTYEFKITTDASWNKTNYGDGGSGTMSTSGGNMKFPGGGYYRVAANTAALTWSVTATTWAIIGNAPTASNNWGNDVPMTYNAASGTWSVTTAMVAGEFKFRANGDWTNNLNNFGDNAPADGIPDYNGGNIQVTAAGNYTVTLNLSHSGNYIYTLKKN